MQKNENQIELELNSHNLFTFPKLNQNQPVLITYRFWRRSFDPIGKSRRLYF